MNKKNFPFLTIARVVLTIVFLSSLGYTVFYLINNGQSQKNLDTLTQDIVNARQLTQNQESSEPPTADPFFTPAIPSQQPVELTEDIPLPEPTETSKSDQGLKLFESRDFSALPSPLFNAKKGTATIIIEETAAAPVLRSNQKAMKTPETATAKAISQKRLLQSLADLLIVPARAEAEQTLAQTLPNSQGLAAQTTDAPPSPTPQTQNPLLAGYQALNQRNPDFAGWIYIPDTVVDYPVMYTPDDPEKYIHKDFDGNYSLAGLPFMDVNNPPDTTGVNQLIYAHNMRSGQMFAILHQFYKDEYWDKYKRVNFDTLELQREYEVLALLSIIIGPMDKPSMMIFHSLHTGTPEGVDQINQYLAHYATRLDGEVQLGDDLITLVTCRKLSDSDRLLLVARKKAD